MYGSEMRVGESLDKGTGYRWKLGFRAGDDGEEVVARSLAVRSRAASGTGPGNTAKAT
jgi:hypothetical protein